MTDRASRPVTRLWRAAAVLALASALAFVVVAPPERCPSVTSGELRDSSQAAVDWFVRNQERDGTWLYEYDAVEDSGSPEYNVVRHAGVTMGLYQAAGVGLPGAMQSADRGADWARERLLERGDWSAVEYLGEVETGAAALLVAGLVTRRDATGDTRYDVLLRRLGRFLLMQTEPSGAVLASYDPDRGEPVPGEYSKYFTGEAYWALASLHLAFPGEMWGEGADRIGAYLASSRDEAESHWPPVPDHWAAYGQSQTVRFPERGSPPLTEQEVDYARDQAKMFGAFARWTSQQSGPWGEIVRGADQPRGGWYGVMGEALTGWWLTAQADPRLADLRGPIAERARCVAGLAVEEQSDAEEAAGFADPERMEGAWFRDGETRMDDQQHALAGLLRTIPIAEADPDDGSTDEAPSAWLWAIVLLLALNPARGAFGVPRAGRTPREVVALVATGGSIGGLAVCAAAVLGGPVLDWLDVSESSFRVAVGIVAVLAGAADLFRRPPPPEPALEGRRAALIPVAVPLVARPALVVLALGAGVEQGVLVTAAAMAVAIALLAWLAARVSHERALRWTARLLAAGLIAGGAILLLSGTLDV